MRYSLRCLGCRPARLPTGVLFLNLASSTSSLLAATSLACCDGACSASRLPIIRGRSANGGINNFDNNVNSTHSNNIPQGISMS